MAPLQAGKFRDTAMALIYWLATLAATKRGYSKYILILVSDHAHILFEAMCRIAIKRP